MIINFVSDSAFCYGESDFLQVKRIWLEEKEAILGIKTCNHKIIKQMQYLRIQTQFLKNTRYYYYMNIHNDTVEKIHTKQWAVTCDFQQCGIWQV